MLSCLVVLQVFASVSPFIHIYPDDRGNHLQSHNPKGINHIYCNEAGRNIRGSQRIEMAEMITLRPRTLLYDCAKQEILKVYTTA